MPLQTPLVGSWLDLVGSLQRIPKRPELDGQKPGTPPEISAWFEAVTMHWGRSPTPFAAGEERQAR